MENVTKRLLIVLYCFVKMIYCFEKKEQAFHISNQWHHQGQQRQHQNINISISCKARILICQSQISQVSSVSGSERSCCYDNAKKQRVLSSMCETCKAGTLWSGGVICLKEIIWKNTLLRTKYSLCCHLLVTFARDTEISHLSVRGSEGQDDGRPSSPIILSFPCMDKR